MFWWQAITWTENDSIHWPIYASLDLNEPMLTCNTICMLKSTKTVDNLHLDFNKFQQIVLEMAFVLPVYMTDHEILQLSSSNWNYFVYSVGLSGVLTRMLENKRTSMSLPDNLFLKLSTVSRSDIEGCFISCCLLKVHISVLRLFEQKNPVLSIEASTNP